MSQLSGGSGDGFPEVAFVILRQFYQCQQDFLLSFMLRNVHRSHLPLIGDRVCVYVWGGGGGG